MKPLQQVMCSCFELLKKHQKYHTVKCTCFCLTAILSLLLYFKNQEVKMHFNLIWQRRSHILSLKETLACLREKCLLGDRIYPGWTDMAGEGAVSVHALLDTGTGSLKELQYLDS